MHHRHLPLLLLISALLSPYLLRAQDAPRDSIQARLDSIRLNTDSTRVAFFFNDFEKLSKLNLHPNDTAITGFQHYDPLYKQNRFYATTGNIGQAYRPLLPYPFTQTPGFDYGIHSSDQYLFTNDSVKYYKVSKTFTEVSFVQGAKKEQNFRAVFSRNLYRSLNLGFDFRVLSAPGFYTRQKANHINFVVTAQFITKKRRYGVIANFLANRIKNYENGGIVNDSLFEQNLEPNRQLIPVNLASAQNRIKETGFFMKHYINLSRQPANPRDSAYLSKKRVDLGRITYSFQYHRQIQNYMDYAPMIGFYPPATIDTNLTYDSITIKKIVNTLVWSNPSNRADLRPRVLQLEAGIRQQYIEIHDHWSHNFLLQFIPHAAIDFNPTRFLRLRARGEYVMGDYNENDFLLQVNLSAVLGRSERNFGVITAHGIYALQQPGWFYQHYIGNNFSWDTTWNKVGVISGGANYRFRNLNAGFSISRISNYVYLDTSGRPRQFTPEMGYFQAYINGDFDLWKFTFSPRLAYQTVQGTTVLRLPAFIGNLSIYFTQRLFKGAATLQPGLDFFYNTSYAGDNYMPATRSFYLQDKKEIGNYLYMDVFINLKVQRARFFVTYTHFNASFMERTYYTTPSYPMPDGAFKFGISWRFHD